MLNYYVQVYNFLINLYSLQHCKPAVDEDTFNKMVERQYELLRRDRLKGPEENRSDGPPSTESTPNSTPTPTPAPMNEETSSEVIVTSNINHAFSAFAYILQNYRHRRVNLRIKWKWKSTSLASWRKELRHLLTSKANQTPRCKAILAQVQLLWGRIIHRSLASIRCKDHLRVLRRCPVTNRCRKV